MAAAVVLIFHVGLAQIYETLGQCRLQLSHFLEFSDGDIEVMLFLGFGSGLQMLQRLR